MQQPASIVLDSLLTFVQFALWLSPSKFSQKVKRVCNRWPILSALPAAGIVAGLCPPWCFKHGTLIIPKPSAWARGFSG